MNDAWTAAVFDFEETEGLKLLPLAARRALDIAGFRLSLEGWQSLSLKDREALVIEGSRDVIDANQVEPVVRRSSLPATRIRPVPEPDALTPPEQLNAALTGGDAARGPIEPVAWSRLRPLDRYALIHVLRRSIAHDDVHRLESAVQLILGRGKPDLDRERDQTSLAAELKRTLQSAITEGGAREPSARSETPARSESSSDAVREEPRPNPRESAPPPRMESPAPLPQQSPWRTFSAPDIEITNGLPTVTNPPPAPHQRGSARPPPLPTASERPQPSGADDTRSTAARDTRPPPRPAISEIPARGPTRPPPGLAYDEAPRARTAAAEELEPSAGGPPTTRPGSDHPSQREATASLGNHLDSMGHVHMVDVGSKDETLRRATARGSVRMQRETAQRLLRNDAPKGEVLATARVAGIMAAKRTAELIPLCHAIALTHVEIHIDVDANAGIVSLTAVAEARYRTGVEMEALTAVSIAALTIYDMLKGIDRELVIGETRLLEKSGGKAGVFTRD